MAMADIAEDDLGEVMRGEAEDVFFQDGKACQGSVVKCESRRGLIGGPRGWNGSLRNPVRSAGCFVSRVVIRVKKRPTVMVRVAQRDLFGAGGLVSCTLKLALLCTDAT